MFERVDHIGIVVEDLDASIKLYEETFELRGLHRELLAEHGVEIALLDVGESHVELLRPLNAEHSTARFLAERGPGIHHVAYGVKDIDATLQQLKTAGMELIDETPRTGLLGARIAFLAPQSVGGVLTELVERPEG
ncbi:MAG TPA: methylmalonyl-CoA epimerase [Baekduia sp.]|nr:methylmalonyl-CoA epimerase [Baekduia sp.]